MNLCNVFFAVAFSSLLPSVLSQRLTITSPEPNAVVTPGAATDIVLHLTSTTSSVKQVACTLGLRPVGGGKALYVSNTAFNANGPKFDEQKLTYTWTVTLPSADKFGEGIGQSYNLTLSQYYLISATSTPVLSEFSSLVTVK
ncbi:uncharacterized protein MELLADRAFT_67301 [Melampsora larici-populina 98AG31]|uniref:Secreted protein n=1 Tax=Melampsora larici-populina (strain 98AG31 / pathotype 3-4-7) TaxID=747676 RepID=F4S2W9_MELLP|nr:uncharacterized protein MELLADRAFT_67301 [Melampsora larici-populina 98AG31]EGG01118.1 secreted protein [Melampsora larici-populina 98AG31]